LRAPNARDAQDYDYPTTVRPVWMATILSTC